MAVTPEEWHKNLKEIYPDMIADLMKLSDCDPIKTLKQLSSLLKKDFKLDDVHTVINKDGKDIKIFLKPEQKIHYEIKIAQVKLRAIETFVNAFIKPIIPQNFNLKHTGFEDFADRLAAALDGDGTKPKKSKS